MAPSLLLLLRISRGSIPSVLPSNLHSLRHMGGGPRTFPGGLSKWKYRRMHEKLAREKERRLLDQEKQLYQARLRTSIRAQIADPSSDEQQVLRFPYGPVTPKQHIKALADRFMKRSAEDLWNEDDGPLLSSPPKPPGTPPPLDLRRLVCDRPGLVDGGGSGSSWKRVESFYQRREYSVMARRELKPRSGGRFRSRRGLDTDSDSDSSYSIEKGRFPKFNFGSEGPLDKHEEYDSRGARNSKMMTRAALGNHDKKQTRRVPIDLLEKISTQQAVQDIREELGKTPMNVKGPVRCENDKNSTFTEKRFDECNISPLTIKALTSAGYEKLSVVQAAALPICLDGKDALVKAKAGTGKSAAFLLPTIEAVLKATCSHTNYRVHPILALILCPTRELASQIAAEANVLLMHHAGITVQTLIGGTRFKVDQKLLETNPPQIVVATPGRLLDHIENKTGFSVRLMGLKVLVIDEVDHLLDLGFQSDIEKIMDCVPRQRQSLLFSATIPKEIRRISQLVLNKEHVYVDTVGLGGSETHDKV